MLKTPSMVGSTGDKEDGDDDDDQKVEEWMEHITKLWDLETLEQGESSSYNKAILESVTNIMQKAGAMVA